MQILEVWVGESGPVTEEAGGGRRRQRQGSQSPDARAERRLRSAKGGMEPTIKPHTRTRPGRPWLTCANWPRESGPRPRVLSTSSGGVHADRGSGELREFAEVVRMWAKREHRGGRARAGRRAVKSGGDSPVTVGEYAYAGARVGSAGLAKGPGASPGTGSSVMSSGRGRRRTAGLTQALWSDSCMTARAPKAAAASATGREPCPVVHSLRFGTEVLQSKDFGGTTSVPPAVSNCPAP